MLTLSRRAGWRRLSVCVAAVLAAAPHASAAAQTPLTLDDVRRMPGTPWLGISPDGNTVAYLLVNPGAPSDLWRVPAGGGTPQRLTDGAGVRSVVGWSPAGDRVAFVAGEGDDAAVWIVAPGSEPRSSCRLPRGARSIAWLADGLRLSFAARATDPGASDRGAADASGESVFLCDSRTGETRRVTPNGYFGLEFAWAPYGERLVLSAQREPGFYEALESDLFLVDTRTGAETPLVTRPGVDRSPLWSPDGREIAFISGFGRSGLLPNLGIAVVRPGHTAPRDIGKAHDRGGFFEGPSLHGWSADGRDIFYSVVDGLEVPLFRVAAAGGEFARVELPAGDREASYQYSISADGRTVAYKTSSTAHPPEIFAVRPGEPEAVRLTRINRSLADRGVPLAERVRWNAPDGATIEGMLLRPEGPGPHPLVTVLHGGPASAYNLSFPGLAFFDPYRDPLLAARGYAVLLPNPRGSGGYGERFRAAARRDWGTTPAADVHAGIDHLVAQGIADSTRLALMGWSYGGYLAAWMIAHSDRFAVASAGAGVYDLTSHYGQAAPQMEEYFGGPPWRLPALYRDQSPVQHVGRIRTPTLVFHGEADNAVSIAQAELFSAALRAEGVPMEFIRYPGEGHSLRQADAQDDSFERLVAWLDRWLAAPDSERRDDPIPVEYLPAAR